MKRVLVCMIALLCLALGLARAEEPADKPLVQLAILLDTSNSMDGLINQAKAQLWKVVNECAVLKRDGARPTLQVALYEYGNDGLPRATGHIRQVLPLTTDLDKVSEMLFALRTNGGQEYCGQVVSVAVNDLAWSKSNKDLKLIFIAGNEPFTQGRIDYRESCKAAIAKGIMVNTIHCGSYDEGVQGKWQDGALLADGKYMNIDQNQAVVHIAAPQDAEILKLNDELNKTYIHYGAKGMEGAARQAAQDKNAEAVGAGSNVNRVVSKSSHAYSNAEWDLADAVKEKSVKLEEMKEADLPEDMKKLKPEERQAYVEKKLKERAEIQEQIKKLNADREKHVAEEMKKQKPGENTLDAAMVKMIQTQAEKREFKQEK